METANQEKANKYNQKRLRLIESMLSLAIKHENKLAYPYATLPDARIGHGFNTPHKGNLSTIGAAHAILSLLEYDPFLSFIIAILLILFTYE